MYIKPSGVLNKEDLAALSRALSDLSLAQEGSDFQKNLLSLARAYLDAWIKKCDTSDSLTAEEINQFEQEQIHILRCKNYGLPESTSKEQLQERANLHTDTAEELEYLALLRDCGVCSDEGVIDTRQYDEIREKLVNGVRSHATSKELDAEWEIAAVEQRMKELVLDDMIDAVAKKIEEKIPHTLSKTGMYRLLGMMEAALPEVPPGLFGLKCSKLTQEFSDELEQHLSLYPIIDKETFLDHLGQTSHDLLVETFLPDVYANYDMYSQEEVEQMLDEAIDKCETEMVETPFYGFLKQKGIFKPVPEGHSQSDVPKYNFDLDEYLNRRSALKTDYASLDDGDVNTQFALCDRMFFYHLILRECAKANLAFDRLNENPELASLCLNTQRIKDMTKDIKGLGYSCGSQYEQDVCAPANTYLQTVINYLETSIRDCRPGEMPSVETADFVKFEQQEFDHTICAIYEKPLSELAQVQQQIMRDMSETQSNPYIRALTENGLFNEDEELDIDQYVKVKEALDKKFLLDAQQNGMDGKKAITAFERTFQYEQFCIIHKQVSAALSKQAELTRNGGLAI